MENLFFDSLNRNPVFGVFDEVGKFVADDIQKDKGIAFGSIQHALLFQKQLSKQIDSWMLSLDFERSLKYQDEVLGDRLADKNF